MAIRSLSRGSEMESCWFVSMNFTSLPYQSSNQFFIQALKKKKKKKKKNSLGKLEFPSLRQLDRHCQIVRDGSTWVLRDRSFPTSAFLQL